MHMRVSRKMRSHGALMARIRVCESVRRVHCRAPLAAQSGALFIVGRGSCGGDAPAEQRVQGPRCGGAFHVSGRGAFMPLVLLRLRIQLLPALL